DAAGNTLDPLGVRLADGYYLSAVAWNGESFLVLTGQTLVFVSPDLKTITSTKLDLSGYSFVAMSPGPDVRFLFIGFNNGNAAVVNSRGEVVKRTTIWVGAGSWGAAGASDTSFLVLRSLISDGLPVLSYRLDRDGNLVSSDDSRLPIDRLSQGEETLA